MGSPFMESIAPLDVDALKGAAPGLVVGSEILYLAETESTNSVAREVADRRWQEGLVVITDYQTAGRGRLARRWVAPPNTSLLFSAMVTSPPAAGPSDGVMLASLAVADTLAAVVPAPIEVKWPNDVLCGGRKICGILSESLVRGGLRRTILGIGINVNFDPVAMGIDATSVLRETGALASRERLAARLFNALDLWYRMFTREPEDVFRAWAARLITVGQQVEIADSGGMWEAVAVSVDRDGALRVRRHDGSHALIHSGDVRIRRPGGFTSP